MQVVVPPPPPTVAAEFNFDSNCSSPYITAPSSPQRFANNFFFSAPTSPTRISTFLNNNNNIPSSSSSLPFQQQEFQFHFTDHLQPPSLSAADELFHAGKIRPFKLPQSQSGLITSPFSPHRKTESFDPSSAMENQEQEEEEEKPPSPPRGREKRAFSGRKGSRSLSPLRISDVVSDNRNEDTAFPPPSSSASNNTKASYASFLSSISFTRGYRKWRLKDFLLFRSASEGRATDKDPLRRKYEVLSKREKAMDDDVRNSSSFRSSDGSVSKRRGPVSAHEIHYTANRAASEEMKKRTPLPYKTGLLGCLGFNPNGMHEISRGIGSFTRS
ncbi:hypothetical protein PIB30_061550 [Stylosanthes scabra]|uniref:Calmodulin-binding protein n=1 Tax=Stylosanthes scabra TaxID=79078 RepID=A0ABU6SMQ3_9FABA|nr:hypothetical protein [Stylosanthes scabra]